MALQLIRGNTTDRLTYTPSAGEIVYDTQTKKVYVGDGSAIGGNLVGFTGDYGDLTNAPTLATVATSADYNDLVNAPVLATVATSGNYDDLTNKPAIPESTRFFIAGDDSTQRLISHGETIKISGSGGVTVTTDTEGNITIAGSSANIVLDTTPQLGGNLDVNGYEITSAANGNIVINPNGTGEIDLASNVNVTGNIQGSYVNIVPTNSVLVGNDTYDGNMYFTRNNFTGGRFQGITLAQHHEYADVDNFTFYRSRGTSTSPATVINGDRLGDIVFLGASSTTTSGTLSPPNGAVITAFVDGNITDPSHIPTKFRFATNNGSAFAGRAELSAAGIWKIDQLGGYTGTNITMPNTNTITIGDTRFSQDGIATVASNANLTITANGNGIVTVESLSITGYTIDATGATGVYVNTVLKLKEFPTTLGANAAVGGTAVNGMIIYNSTTHKFQGYANGSWIDLH